MTTDTSNPIKRGVIGAFVLLAIPLLPTVVPPALWLYRQYRRAVAWYTPDCPVCGDAMTRVSGVGYVCDRPGCVAYGDTLDRARARD